MLVRFTQPPCFGEPWAEPDLAFVFVDPAEVVAVYGVNPERSWPHPTRGFAETRPGGSSIRLRGDVGIRVCESPTEVAEMLFPARHVAPPAEDAPATMQPDTPYREWAIYADEDPYRTIASSLLDIERDGVSSRQCDAVKRVCFGLRSCDIETGVPAPAPLSTSPFRLRRWRISAQGIVAIHNALAKVQS